MEPTRLFTRTPYTLQVHLRDGTLKSYPILKSVVTVGRDPENDLVIDDPSISRQHAILRVDIAGISIEDRHSSNGTFIGGQRLNPEDPKRIPPGKGLRLGTLEANIPGLPITPGWTNKLRQGGIPILLVLLGTGLVAFLGVLIIAGGILYLRSRPHPVTSVVATQTAFVAQIQATQKQATQSASSTAVVEQQLLAAPKCDQPGMMMLKPGQIYVPGSPGVPGRVITSTAFLDLPFPYDGGNVNFGGTYQQFLIANQRNNGKGGRINSFFDHYLPVYPCSKDPKIPSGQEPCEPPIGQFLLRFDGILTQDSYSGHPGYDYSTFEYRKPTTPVFAAADGKILYAGTHSASGALFVEISHTVPGVGDFMTLYWHLNPDQFFDAMLGQEGKPIKAGTRIGTMGNTGFSTGHHLHFEVRFDANKDGKFSMSEVIDPYGYIPSPMYPTDPWYDRTFIHSSYLWIYPLGITAQIPANGGGDIPMPGNTTGTSSTSSSTESSSDVICVLPYSLPPGGTVSWSYDSPPAPTDPNMVSPGGGGVLSVIDPNGLTVPQFTNPLRVTIPYIPDWLTEFDNNSLSIYLQPYGSQTWEPLETRFDAVTKLAYALTDRPGRFALFGKPKVDMIPPKTQIKISGPEAADGTLDDVVTVTLQSSDSAGIAEQLYSLDDGTTWQKYTGPFQVSPNGIPSPLPVVMDADFHGGTPGTLLVLASATDKAGNVEDPPTYLEFSIDPSKNPAYTLTQEKMPEVKVTEVTSRQAISETAAVGPDNFPAGTNPLTGQPCKQPDTISLAPAGVSVTNFPVSARPQAGLSFAPWVHEMFIGEGMTRFLALFYCDFPAVSSNVSADNAVIGPIRSGRLPYESIRKLFSGFLVMASADPSVGVNLGESVRVYGSDENDINSALIKVDNLKAIAQQSSQGKPPPNLTGNRFDPQPPPGGKDAKNLWIFYNFLDQVLWNYDSSQGVYLRSQDNADGSGVFTPSTDRLNNQRLSTDNVIVLYAAHSVLNRAGTMIDIDLLFTKNIAYLFRDGKMYPIYWDTTSGDYEKTTGRMRPYRFVDQNGNPFPLKPGNTWVEIVDFSATTQEIQPGDWKVRFYAPEPPK